MSQETVQEVVQVLEGYDSQSKFTHSKVFFRENGNLYYTTSKIPLLGTSCSEMPTFDVNSADVLTVPTTALYVEWIDGITKSNEASYLAMNVYIKTPSLVDYDPTRPWTLDSSSRVAPEVKILETLKAAGGHENIEEYHGCTQSPDGRYITGICLKKYVRTLMDICDAKTRRQRLAVAVQGKDLLETDVAEYTLPTTPEQVIEGVIKGLQYLHGLDIIHCDINPSNIMFDEGGRPVLIDFNVSVKKGEERAGPGTFLWSDDFDFSTIAIEDLDIRGVYRIVRYLHEFFALDDMALPRHYNIDNVNDDFPTIKKWLLEKIDCARLWVMKEIASDVGSPVGIQRGD